MTNRQHHLHRRSFLAGLACAGAASLLPGVILAQQPAIKKPVAKKAAKPELDLRTLVPQTLAKNPYYSPGFLISRRDAEPIYGLLLEKRLTRAADQDELYDALLSDHSPLVNRLKTPIGRAFMKKVVNDPTAYDRLERLSWTADGRRLLDSLLSAKDGYERFQKLQTPADLAKVSKALAADPRTPEFAIPTGRLHTADQLVKMLEDVIAQAGAEPHAAGETAAR